MKKIFLLLICILLCLCSASAEIRHVTIIQGGNYLNSMMLYPTYKSCDLFEVKIDGTKYFLMSGSGEFSRQKFLGCSEQSKYDMFTPLRNLEKDGDYTRLTADELKASGIRLVAQNFDGTIAYNNESKDFPLGKISYVDMTRLRITPSAIAYGNFDIYLKKDGGGFKKNIGKVQMMPIVRTNRFY